MKKSLIFLFLLINLIHLLNTLNSESFRKLYTQKDEKLALKLYNFINNIPINCKNKTQEKCNSICYKYFQNIEIPLQQDDKKNMIEKLLKVYYDKTIPQKNKKKEMGVVVINFLKIIEKNKENQVVVRKSTTNRLDKKGSAANRSHTTRSTTNRPDKTGSTTNRPDKKGSTSIRPVKKSSGANRPHTGGKASYIPHKISSTTKNASNRPIIGSAANRPLKISSGANSLISIEKVINFFKSLF